MNLDYMEVPNIKLEEMSIFANYEKDLVYRYLKQNDIHTLRELISNSDSNTFFLGKCINSTKKRVEGVIDLLRCEYLNEPLKASIYYEMPLYKKYLCENQVFIEFNSEISFAAMGFTKTEKERFQELLKKLKKDINVIELLYITKEYIVTFLKTYKFKDKCTINLYTSFLTKVNILISYYEKIYSRRQELLINNEEFARVKKIRNLYAKLNSLYEEQEKIQEQIREVENEIGCEICLSKVK